MQKILIVAQTEFLTLVRSKGFIAGVLLLPVMMGLSIGLTRASRRVTDNKERRFAIVDYTGAIGAPLVAVSKLFGPGSLPGDARPGGTSDARFIPVEIDPRGRRPDDLRLELSDRVRTGELFAFVEFPENVMDPAGQARIQYYSDHPSYPSLPAWLQAMANGVIISERFKRASIDRALVARLSKQAPVDNLELFEREADGRIRAARKVDTARAIGVPVAIMGLMFITIISSGPALLNSVIEEKMTRISEVLMGSLTPFQLMVGKLIGSVSVSVLLS
ncbi:MAG: type transport system permease protein, partial [Acidobacteriota bacterium]